MLTFQNPDTREEGVVVGAEEPGGDPTLKLGLVDLELGHLENEKIPEQNISCQQKPIGEDTPQPSPTYGEGLLRARWEEQRAWGRPTFRASPQSTIS